MTRLSASCVVVTKMRKSTIEIFFQVELGFFLQVIWVFLEMLI